MLRYLLIVFFFFSYSDLCAQTLPLMVQLDEQKKPYLNHTIGVKENFYSIGRIYNISPKVFAPYNGMELTSGLSIGQTIKIPLNEANFWQNGARKGNETVVPVYHQVQGKETVTSVCKLYNADKTMLVSWNNISDEKISVGDKLIIGFLKVDKALSPLAAQGVGPRAEPPSPKVEEKKEEPKIPAKPLEDKKTPAQSKLPNRDSIKQATLKKEEKAVVSQPDPTEQKNTVTPPVLAVQKPDLETLSTYKGDGHFKEEYNTQTNSGKNIQKSTMKGGSFKSTSGWTDGKYYILIDGIERGTILKLLNTSNKKVIYAKVLAGIAETKPGASEAFLISNAAAQQLGLSSSTFELEISWEK